MVDNVSIYKAEERVKELLRLKEEIQSKPKTGYKNKEQHINNIDCIVESMRESIKRTKGE